MKELLNKRGYYIIAEIGVNYYDIARKEGISNIDAAKRMCLEAYKAGADAVKFQSYKAEKIASIHSPAYWDLTEETTISQYELFKKFDLFEAEDYKEIADYCCDIGVEFMSTPFDFEAVDYLDTCMNYYKISSSDLTNLPFIEYIAKKDKPIFLSTGAGNEYEIEKAIAAIRKYNSKEMALLHCVLEYPTPYEHAMLNRIKTLYNKFDTMIGYSDHTKPDEDYTILTTAFAYGAQIIEKHFTLDKTLKGNDHYHAMDPDDLKKICSKLDYIKTISGQYELTYLESEEPARKNARRSIVTTTSVEKGEIILREMLMYKRPGTGISRRLMLKML